MPNPHFDVQIITRGQAQSVVAAAAYRSGEVIYDERAGKTFDYSRKEDVLHAEIMAPANAPAWATDRALLWNHVEASEKRVDARLARTIIAGLPRELDHQQNIALVRGYVHDNFTSKGMIADFAIHESEAGDGFKNPHVHILLTTRDINRTGFGGKNRSWDHKNALYGWRNSWEAHTNRHLEMAGRVERVSLKSYKQQGKDKTPQVHLGEEIGNLEKRGVETKKGDFNRKVRHENLLTQILEWQADQLDPAAYEESTPEKAQFRHRSDFLAADPTIRLEAMTLELKDDMNEYADQKSENGNQQSGVNGKEGVLGVFRNQNKDSEDLAVASLEASKALNEAALSAYLESPEHQRSQKQMMEKVRLAEYHRLTAERFKALVAGQIRPLSRETEQTRQKERSDELER